MRDQTPDNPIYRVRQSGVMRDIAANTPERYIVDQLQTLSKRFSEEGLTSRHPSGTCLPQTHGAHGVFGGRSRCAASVVPSPPTPVKPWNAA
jgi:hypothetical protein